MACGQAANSQAGPERLTYEPSGHSFASSVHAPGDAGPESAAPPGHASNSQFGPVRATAEPSGQIIASAVQALSGSPGALALGFWEQAAANNKNNGIQIRFMVRQRSWDRPPYGSS